MNNITTKAKNLAYYAVGSSALLLTNTASADAAADAAAAAAAAATAAAGGSCTGANQEMTGCVGGLIDQILTLKNIGAISKMLTFVGLIIVIWKITEIIFKGEPAKDKIGMLLGGIIIAILGTKFAATLTLLGYTLPQA
jgi:hypothetical protein